MVLASVPSRTPVQIAAEKEALKQAGRGGEYFASRQYGEHSPLAWTIIDHGIENDYLWKEYRRSFQERTTAPCDTSICRRCGVCTDET